MVNNMAKIYKDFTSLFKDWDNGVKIGIEKTSKIVRDIWKQKLEDRFYGVYSPISYKRTFETLDSITSFSVKKTSNGYSVDIYYDTSKITTRVPQDGDFWGIHTEPENQSYFVEYGWEMPNGQIREGAHAFDEMLNYVNSDEFIALFKNEMKKLGYTFK